MTSETKAADMTPALSCEREPIHIVNRIQPCGTLLVVDSNLTIVQCSTNACDLLPPDYKPEDDNNTTNKNLNLSATSSELDVDKLDPRLQKSKLRDDNGFKVDITLLNSFL